MVVDELSPIGSTRASVNPGIYLPRMPGLTKLELRAEGFNESLTKEFTPGFVYTDGRRFRDGYTNSGMLMGSWIGRAGRGGQGWLIYSWSPRTKVQMGYRHQDVSHSFVGGGRLADYSIQGDASLGARTFLSTSFTFEQWYFPVLTPTWQSNYIASVKVTFNCTPRLR